MKKLLLLSVIITLRLNAQDPVAVTPYQVIDARTGQGIACAGCSIYTYAAGTTTPLATYTDYTLGTPNTNPVLTNSAGYAVDGSTITGIWVGASCYKFILKDPSAVTIWTQDHICDEAQVLKVLLAGSSGAAQIGYQFPGSSTLRTVQDKLSETISVLDFGAKGDGVTDDSTAFSAAASACTGVPSCTVIMPGGHTYVIDTGVSLTSTSNKGMVFAGDGQRNTVINYGGSGWLFQVSGSAGLITFSGFTCNGTSSAAGCIFINTASPTNRISNVEVSGFSGATAKGIQIGSAVPVVAEETRVDHCNLSVNTTDIYVHGNQVVIEDNDFSGSGVSIDHASGAKMSILRNTLQSNTSHAINIEAGLAISIRDNYFEAAGDDFILVASTYGLDISANHFQNSTSHYSINIGAFTTGATLHSNDFAGTTTAAAQILLAGGTSTTYIYSFGSSQAGAIPIFQLTSPLISGLLDDTETGALIQPSRQGGSLYSTTSGSLPSVLSGNKMLFESDINNIGVYNGSSWLNFQPFGAEMQFTGTAARTDTAGSAGLTGGTYTYTFSSGPHSGGYYNDVWCTANNASSQTPVQVTLTRDGGGNPTAVTFTSGAGTDTIVYHCIAAGH